MPPDQLWIDYREEDRVLAEARARRQQFDVLKTQITPEMAMQAITFTRQWPNASPGLVAAATTQGMTPERFGQVAQLDDGGGGIGGFFGGLVGGAFDLVGSALEQGWEQVVKPAIRGAVTILDTAQQELVQRPYTALLATAQTHGAVGFGEAYQGYGNSPGLIAMRNLFDSDPDTRFDLGQGFFAGGQVAEESRRQKTMLVNGEPLTLGNTLAAGVLGRWQTPGDRAYDITAGVTQFAADVAADPGAFLTGGVSAAVKAGRTLDAGRAVALLDDAGRVTDDALRAVGAVANTRRHTVLAERATQFFRDPDLLRRIADADPYDLYQSWSKSPARRIDLDTIGRLGRSTDEGEIAEILLEQVARGHVTERGFYGGAGRFVRSRVANMRLAGVSPRGLLDADDLDDAADKLDSFLRQANVAREDRAEVFGALANLQRGDAAGLFEVATDAMGRVAAKLTDLDPDLAVDDVRALTRLFGDDAEAFRRYGVDRLGDPITTPFTRTRIVDADGTTVLLPTPQLSSELNALAIPLPDVTEVRRAATEMALLRSVYTSAGWKLGTDTMHRLTRKVFKPAALLRPAYVVRIGAEEQARLAASGMDSLFTHPWRFLQANVLNRKAMTDLVGDDLTKRANALGVINRDATGMLADATRSRTHLWDTIAKGMTGDAPSETFITAWRHELAQLAAAPEARHLASVRGNLDEFVDWARNTSAGRETVERVARINDEARALLTDDRVLREWGETVWQRIAAKTGQDGDLLDVLTAPATAGVDVADELADANLNRLLRSKYDVAAPAYVKVERAAAQQGVLREHYDRALTFLFDNITSKPTSYFARFPAWRQQIIRSVGDLMPSMADDALRGQAIRAAREALDLTRPEARALAQAAARAKGIRGPLAALDEVNDIALGRSAEVVKDLLFDITRRSAAQDTLDVIFPFLDAYVEVTKTWAKRLADRPSFFVRAQSGYESLGEQGAGVFYVNDFGDEVFAYPGGGALSAFVRRLNEAGGDLLDVIPAAAGAVADAVTGNTPDASLRLEGRVAGLNLIANGVGPGFGPMVQWATGAFAPDTPDFRRLREWVSPFGSDVESTKDLGSPGGLLESLLVPAWAEKMLNAWTKGNVNEHQWNSTVGDVMRVLATTGPYDPGDPADAQRLIDDAERGGAWVLFVRGLTQATGPTGPGATWALRTDGADELPTDWDPETDPDGRWHTLTTLANEYRRLLDSTGDSAAATATFVQLYGIEPWYVAQAKSRTSRELPVTREGDDWMRANRDVAAKYPAVAGFFAPADADDTFDYSVYADQLERGDRQSLTAEQQLQLANQVKARSIRSNVRNLVSGLDRSAQRRVLDVVDGWLEDNFPGWRFGVLGTEERASNERKVTELERAAEDPQLAGTPLGEPLAVYMAARRMALAAAEARGFTTLGGNSVADLRQALAVLGQELAVRNSSFAAVWQRVLSREAEQ